MKTCSVCHQEKPLEDFYRQSNSADGHNYTCKECSRARSKNWKKNNPEKASEHRRKREAVNADREPRSDGTKVCDVCYREQPRTEFYLNRLATDGRQHSCKDCQKSRNLKWNRDHREQFNENGRRYWENNREGINAKRRLRNETDDEYRERRATERRRYWNANREKLLVQQRDWYNSPEGIAWNRDYKERNKERTRARYVFRTYGLTSEDYELMASAQGHRCAICNKEPKGQWHVDHDHSTGQVRALLCRLCNQGLGSFEDDPERLRVAASYIEKYKALPT